MVTDFDTSQNAICFESVQELVYISLVIDAELIEERLVESGGEAIALEQIVVEIVGCVIGELGSFFQTFLAHQAHVNGHKESHERLVAANVAGSFLTAYVLLASLQCEYEGASSVVVGGLANDASRHLAHHLLCTAHVAYRGASVGHWNTE